MVSVRFALTIFLVVAILGLTVEAGYKKPPFNGSIFGKRSNSESDAEVANRALSAMCEIASEACNAWLSR
ncbi:SIFamide-related peptide [Vespula squamosa]|uniref:SIFamide-related peptide n=1 Tax=Vespula squamosa TaxID=30214 RepID=A0ABD2A0P5_VESSQ